MICGYQIQHSAASLTKGAISEEPPLHDDAYYFWNEVTGETQWEDPGGVAFEDANAQRYWKSDEGTPLLHDPKANLYCWLENWSSEYSRPYYYNQKSKKSQWEKPEDLAWRRVKAVPTDGSQTDDSLINVSGEL